MPAMLLVGVGMALPYLILSAFPEAGSVMVAASTSVTVRFDEPLSGLSDSVLGLRDAQGTEIAATFIVPTAGVATRIALTNSRRSWHIRRIVLAIGGWRRMRLTIGASSISTNWRRFASKSPRSSELCTPSCCDCWVQVR